MAAPAEVPMDLGSWIGRRAAATPRLPAITFDGHTTSYGELLDRIDRLAAELAAGGVGRGDRVGYLGLNDPMFLITLFAAARIGAVFVPLNYRLTAAELGYILADAGVHTLLADARHAAVAGPVLTGSGVRRALALSAVPGWEPLPDLLANRGRLAAPVHPRSDEVAVIMYTSGTTGRPKGAMLTHGNLFWNNVNALLSFDVSQDDVSLVAAPLFHIGGLNVTTLVTLQKGGQIVLMPAFDPGQALKLIAEYRVTTMFGVPAMFLFMSQVPEFAAADLSSVRFLICGGAPVPETLISRYGQRGIAFVQGYGLTETAPLALVLRADEVSVKAGAAGHAVLPLSDVRLVDAENNPVAPGERGEICVRGPQVMAGYWHNREATDAVIDAGGWFHTGDIGQADQDGYVYVVDRLKEHGHHRRGERLPRRSGGRALPPPSDRRGGRARDTARAVGRSGHRRGRAEPGRRPHPRGAVRVRPRQARRIQDPAAAGVRGRAAPQPRRQGPEVPAPGTAHHPARRLGSPVRT